jgi:cytidylate kinase
VGKGTIMLRLAHYLGWHTLDSGAIYRVLALAALQHQIALDHVAALVELAARLDLQFQPLPDLSGIQVRLEQRDVTAQLRTEQAGAAASQVAVIPKVRAALLQRQRDFRQAPGLVADGRDMGTVVFPDAPLKIFLTASAEERAIRRYKQLKEKGIDANLASLIEEIAARDQRDSERAAAPLKPAAQAHVIDTTTLSIEAVMATLMTLIAIHLGDAVSPLAETGR